MLIDKIEKKRILVVGDFMLDSYWSGTVDRISPEAPVPVFLRRSNRFVMGGAANVVANLVAAGQEVVAASVIGMDEYGEILLRKLECLGCFTDLVFSSEQRKTTVKTRILAQNNQQLLRIDDEQCEELSKKEEKILIEGIEKQIKTFDAILLSDYLKGVLSINLCKKVIEIANRNIVPVFIDIKDMNVEKYFGATLVKPNKKELHYITGMPVDNSKQLKEACGELQRRCKCGYVLVTLGADGMALYSNETMHFISCEAKEVFDVSGAGDTVISYLTACYINNYSMLESAKIANTAAGLKVAKVGTATVSIEELKKYLDGNIIGRVKPTRINKVVTEKELIKILKDNLNKSIVFTNGCFDILHAGHVSYLNEAASFGDLLVLGLNSDTSVKRLKGEKRPINSLEDRALVLGALESIDYIVVFDDDTPEKLIREIKPDVLVKGADYKEEDVVGADFVKANGGQVKLVSFLDRHSTTKIIEKVERGYHE